MKHPLITEEHASDIWEEAVSLFSATPKFDFISKLKKEGFIKKSPVEEIKEIYKTFTTKAYRFEGYNKEELKKRASIIHDMYKIIIDLEKQIEEMKK